MSYSGCDGGDIEARMSLKAAEAQVNYWMNQGKITFTTRNECEQSRSFVMSEGSKYSSNNCRIRFTASPCVGSGATSESINVLGPSQGSSFFAPNNVDEIKNWSEDYSQKRLALDDKYTMSHKESVMTGDNEFDKAREGYTLSGFMPKGTTGFIKNDITLSYTGFPSRKGEVIIPEDLINGERPFNSLGGSSSDDLRMYKGDLKPVPPIIRETKKETIDWMELIRDDAKFAWSIYEVLKESGVVKASNKSIPGALVNANINVWSETIDYSIKFYNDEPYQEKAHIISNPIINNILVNTFEDYVSDIPYTANKKLFNIEDKSNASVGLGILGITASGIDLAKRHYNAFKTLWNNE